MRSFLVKIEFNGKNYFGYQRQNNKKTIQGEIETALEKLFNQKIEISGCSRTDSGVSAKCYYFQFFADTKLPTERVPFKLNRFLPNDIQAQGVTEVLISYNLRNSIVQKTYSYSFYVSKHIRPLLNMAYRLECVDQNNFNIVSKLLTGKHNFKAFASSGGDDTNYIRNINKIYFSNEGEILKMYISADGFLYNMVRIIAGVFKAVAEKTVDISDIEEMLNSGNRNVNIITLPPKPLVLENVLLKG